MKNATAIRVRKDTPATFLFGYEEDVAGGRLSILMSWW